MEADWEKGIAFVLEMEGGSAIENDPNDPGGLTHYGISHQAYPNLDISSLTLDQAKAIYKKDFWQACSCDDLPSHFALAVFDCAVNMGSGSSRRLLQMALGVEVDGVIGPITLAAAAKASPRSVKRLLALRLAEYVRRILKNPTLLMYATNWSFRVLSLAELINKPE